MAGQSGNPDGGRRARLWKAAIERTVLKPVNGKVDLQRLDSLAEALILAGEAGDIAALKEIGDRIDGKVPQAIVGGSEDDAPIRLLTNSDADIIARYNQLQPPEK